MGGVGLPLKKVEPWQFLCAYQHGQGSLVSIFAGGKTDPLITVGVDGRTGHMPASVLANDRMWQECWDDIEAKVIIGGVLGGGLGLGLCFGLAVWMRDRGRKAAQDRIVAGTQIVSERELRNLTKRATNDRSLRIATVGIPAWLECRHFAILGTTGLTSQGTFIARPFPAVSGNYPLVHATFYAPGAPIGAWGEAALSAGCASIIP